MPDEDDHTHNPLSIPGSKSSTASSASSSAAAAIAGAGATHTSGSAGVDATAVLVLGQLMVLVVHRANSQCGLACAALLALPAAQVGSSSTSKHVEPLRGREHTHAALRASGCCSTLSGIWPFVVDCVGLAHGVRTQWLLVRVVLAPSLQFCTQYTSPPDACVIPPHVSVWSVTPH